MRTRTSCCLIALVSCMGWGLASAQTPAYPNRPVRIVIPSSPGGTMDFVTRLIGPKMTQLMGQSVIIENRPGASTNIGAEIVARSPADGYTLLSIGFTLVTNPSLFDKLPFDVEKDFAPVSLLANGSYVLVVHPSVPVTSVKELIALAKARPRVLNYSSGGKGTTLHIAAEMFKHRTNTDITHVPYQGGGRALVSLLGGETGLSFLALAPALPYINAGRLRALAITSSQRSVFLPNIPTVAEAGVPGFEFTTWIGILAPAGTPASIIATLNGYIVRAMRAPDLAPRLSSEAVNVIASSPEEFAAQIKTDLGLWSKMLKQSGMRTE